MTKKELIRVITLKEGKKKSISIAQVSEVVKIISDMVKQDPKLICTLLR